MNELRLVKPQHADTLRNWMHWRDEALERKDAEIEAMRGLCDRLMDMAKDDGREIRRWKLIAGLLGAFAAMLFAQPVVERYWP